MGANFSGILLIRARLHLLAGRRDTTMKPGYAVPLSFVSGKDQRSYMLYRAVTNTFFENIQTL